MSTRCRRKSHDAVLRERGLHWVSRLGPFLQTLQADVLAEIFTWCLPDDVEQECKPSLRSAPFNLASVCQTWRKVALGNPALWAKFGIVYESSRIGDEMFYAIPLQWWLRRSRSSPLSFSIRSNRLDLDVGRRQSIYPYEETFIPPLDGLCRNVVAHQHRWKKARMEYYISSPVSEDVTMQLTNMPLLEELYVHFPVHGPRLNVDLTYSSTVRKVSLSGGFKLDFQERKLWSLTSVNLSFNHPSQTFPSMEDVARVLQSAPHLEEIFADVISNVSGSIPNIVMRRLRRAHFVFKISGGSVIQALFRSITLPALRDFVVILGIATVLDNQLDYFGIPDLLERSRAALNSFHIQGMPISQQEILDCLRVSPDMKTLTISGPHLNASFIKNLILRSEERGSECLCPAMERIYIAHCFLADARDYVASMISSRWGLDNDSSRCLKQAGFHQTGLGLGGGLVRLLSIKECIEDGLKLTVTEEDGF